MTVSAQDVGEQRQKKEIKDRWLLSAPALLLILAAGVGPLVIVVIYSFLAPGSYEEYEKLTTIPAVKGKPKALEMVSLLVSAQEATARTARDLLPLVTEANDQPTTDLITQRLDVHEKTAWMLRSLLEE